MKTILPANGSLGKFGWNSAALQYGVKNEEIRPILLEHSEKWEEVVTCIPDEANNNQEAEFLLFKEGKVEPYLKLELWLDVTE